MIILMMVTFRLKKDLQSDFYKNVEQLEAIYDKSNQMHSQNIEQAFVDNEKIENLNQISDSIKDKTQKIQKKFSDTTDSTILRAGKQALENFGITNKDKS
ncbi:hypothetical protein OTSGILL_2965 [Orientia tsutsugamushi str. Gilliam]|uniref:Conjugal transfer protein TraG n=1 Tax=Orientia tsutsugamushi str. Gilliam TaxID=1359184 RepID=A0A0F3M4V0_ORITS|nr:hypothetical protein [Orientia tsutsugamushi]KJV50517.1 hypothetical protein OTSGILL_2965 [Orientia tsutsugamushi str. Gilliam]